MEILVIINESPWGSSLPGAALRFVESALGSGAKVSCVFFQNDGVYNAVDGQLADDGFDAPQRRWRGLGEQQGVELLVCPAAAARRLPRDSLAEPFREAGLTALMERMACCDRVVTF